MTHPNKPIHHSSYPVQRTASEWQSQLTPAQYHILREAGTERAFSGEYWNHWSPGNYLCRGCGAELFHAASKFDAGCGWPSFDRPAHPQGIETLPDTSHGMVRLEVRCQQCGSHLGHVFNDGPTETGLRYCINSASVAFSAP
jgi:peptide-methionine (R)-S-oxide reductase